MAFRLTEGGGNGPHPTEVEGYDRALDLGLLPSVPSSPPRAVTVSSTRVTRWVFAITAVMFLAMPVAERLNVSFVFPGILAMSGILAGIILPSRVRRREFESGYTRMDSHVGIAVVDWKLRFQNGAGPAGAEWDLRGLWLLDSADEPRRPPVEGVLPPGLYPSPHETGKLEYWTGREWCYSYTHPRVPFLEPAG